jgi:hypothetical protein
MMARVGCGLACVPVTRIRKGRKVLPCRHLCAQPRTRASFPAFRTGNSRECKGKKFIYVRHEIERGVTRSVQSDRARRNVRRRVKSAAGLCADVRNARMKADGKYHRHHARLLIYIYAHARTYECARDSASSRCRAARDSARFCLACPLACRFRVRLSPRPRRV